MLGLKQLLSKIPTILNRIGGGKMRANSGGIMKALEPFLVIQDGRRCIHKESISVATKILTSKYSNICCEVSPHKDFPVFTFKVSCVSRVYFEAVVI